MEQCSQLPTGAELRRAIALYLYHAYDNEPPERILQSHPIEDDTDPRQWLMRDQVERDPSDAPLEQVRSFVLRLGNKLYPHMKLRLTRAPRRDFYVFSVDSHDAFLHAKPGSPDQKALEELKRFNNNLARSIHAAWDKAGLNTEHAYLRRLIAEAKGNAGSET